MDSTLAIENFSCNSPLTSPVKTSTSFKINNDFFVGDGMLLVASEDNVEALSLCGKKRKFEFIVRGRFLKSVSFAKLYTGQLFSEPLKIKPPGWLLSIIVPIIKYLQPSLKYDFESDHPYMVSPLFSTMQKIIVTTPDQVPSYESILELEEDDMKLVNPAVFSTMTRNTRKDYFSSRKNLEQYSTDPELVYVFDFYQHLLNLVTWKLEVGYFYHDLVPYLGHQPVSCMAFIMDENSFDALKVSSNSSSNELKESITRDDEEKGSEVITTMEDIHYMHSHSSSDGNADMVTIANMTDLSIASYQETVVTSKPLVVSTINTVMSTSSTNITEHQTAQQQHSFDSNKSIKMSTDTSTSATTSATTTSTKKSMKSYFTSLLPNGSRKSTITPSSSTESTPRYDIPDTTTVKDVLMTEQTESKQESSIKYLYKLEVTNIGRLSETK